MPVVDIIIFAPQGEADQAAPVGFRYARDYLVASRLEDPISIPHRFENELVQTLSYLVKRYPKRILVRWINPWSFLGLWVSLRYRLRTFPAVLINREVVLRGEAIKDLEKHVVDMLAGQPEPDLSD